MQAGALTRIGGEFADRTREARFQAERLPETVRHARILFALSVALNTLFLISDWRFVGTSHFWVAIPARGVVIAVALACFLALSRARGFRIAERIMLAWMWINGAAVSFLVSSHSEIAFFVVLMLPAIYWLAVPTSFRWTAISGIACSAAMLAGYMSPEKAQPTAIGFVLAMVMFNCMLMIVTTRYNRLVRLEALAREELARSRQSLETMLMASPVPMVVTARKDARLLYINDLASRFFDGVGADSMRTLRHTYANEADRARLLDLLEKHGRVSDFETQARTPDGRIRDVLVSAVAIEIDGESALMSGVIDITRRKAAEAHLAHLASTDPLTGLANRNRFFAAIKEAMRDARKRRAALSVAMVDLDHFKRVNDAFGHDAGDRALRLTADMIVEHLPPGGMAARLGGEEFAMLLPGIDQVAAADIAQTLRRSIERHDGNEIAPGLRLTVSIGCAELRPEDKAPEAALARADRALYSAKRAGRNCVRTAPLGEAPDTAA